MTANCKSEKFRRKTGMSKKVACSFHRADKGKYHEDEDLSRMKKLAGINQRIDAEEENSVVDFNSILEALEEAYTFITQPFKMARSSKKGPTILTYQTHKYNQLTAKLRNAIDSLRKK